MSDQRGFTLVELLVAVTVASIGFLGLAATHVASMRATTVGRNTSVATTLASETIEILRRTPYEEVVSASAASVHVGGRYYTRQTVVTPSPAGTSKQVVETVTWSDQFGGHQVQLVTVIAP